MILRKRRPNVVTDAMISALIDPPRVRILCGVCKDADSVRRWVIVDPLVDSVVSYACSYCSPVQLAAVELLKSQSPGLVVTSTAVS